MNYEIEPGVHLRRHDLASPLGMLPRYFPMRFAATIVHALILTIFSLHLAPFFLPLLLFLLPPFNG